MTTLCYIRGFVRFFQILFKSLVFKTALIWSKTFSTVIYFKMLCIPVMAKLNFIATQVLSVTQSFRNYSNVLSMLKTVVLLIILFVETVLFSRFSDQQKVQKNSIYLKSFETMYNVWMQPCWIKVLIRDHKLFNACVGLLSVAVCCILKLWCNGICKGTLLNS